MAMKSVDLTAINAKLELLAGFLLFQEEDVEHYFNDANQFALALPKETGKGYLYGLELVQLRRSIFNQLSQKQRCDVFRSKIIILGLGISFNSSLELNTFIKSPWKKCILFILLFFAFSIASITADITTSIP